MYNDINKTILLFNNINIPIYPYIIFVLFSPQTQFLAQFFSTQKRVNHSKKISTKQRKSPKTWFFNSLMRQNTINCTHHLSNLQIVFTFLTWRTLSTCQSVMWRISSSNNMSCGEISPHGRFFLHGHRPWYPWQIWNMVATFAWLATKAHISTSQMCPH